MATINISYDTKTKIASATIDGKTIKNLSDIRLYRYEYENEDGKSKEESHIEITTREYMEEDKMYKSNTLYATEREGKLPANAINIDYLVDEAKVATELLTSFLLKNRAK